MSGIVNGSIIRSVQSGSILMSGLTAAITVVAVNTSKSALSLLGSMTTGNVGDAAITLTLSNSTTVTATRQASAYAATVAFELLEHY